MRLFVLIPAALLAFASLAAAEEEFVYPARNGVAFAQAPEAGSGVCFGPDATEVMACAQDACMAESGLGPEDCGIDLWCWPHRWVADIFMQHEEGPHWHSFICNAGTRAELDLLVAAKCTNDYLIECAIVRVWDTHGNAVEDVDAD